MNTSNTICDCDIEKLFLKPIGSVNFFIVLFNYFIKNYLNILYLI